MRLAYSAGQPSFTLEIGKVKLQVIADSGETVISVVVL